MMIWKELSEEAPGNIVTLFTYNKNPFPWCVCEFGDTDAARSLRVMGKAEKFKLMDSILTALEVMHSRKYIHNDIKPTNIFRINGIWQLGDFDSTFEEGDAKALKISPQFSSPELIECGENVEKGNALTVKSDIWSMGVLFYYLMNNSDLPFGSGATYTEKLMNCDFKRGTQSKGYDELYEKIFVRDPESRPSATELKEMIKALENQ